VLINGQKLAADVSPVNVSGRIMVPARAIAEALGGIVEWVPERQVVLVYRFDTPDVMALRIGSKDYERLARTDGTSPQFDTAPLLIDGRTLVSVRLVSGFLGAAVEWNQDSRTVSVTGKVYGGQKIPGDVHVAFASRFSALSSRESRPSATATGKTPIIGKPIVTAEVAAAWAKSRGATAEFVALAPIYWSHANRLGGSRVDLAYVQAAKETGFGRFGGVITAAYHNPCGLKTKDAGTGTDRAATKHQTFTTWEEGIQAHLDHLDLYADSPGTPYPITKDPRHFLSIKGKAKYVEDLSGTWATDRNYGKSLINDFLNPLIAFSKTYQPAK
jgi:hypothetical protein